MKEHEIYNLIRACGRLDRLILENEENEELTDKLSGVLTYLSKIEFKLNYEQLKMIANETV